jgi:cyclophilin family peptidyl-prolyl cis-trans isomerase
MNHARRIAIATLSAACIPLAVLAQPKPAEPKPAEPKPQGCASVKLTTSMGPIVLELDKAKAPVSVDNFVKYTQAGHYNGTIFHRVINGFMIQGGGFTKDMRQKPTQPPIKIESSNGLKNEAYTVAMARTSDPNSATSQFFINVKNNEQLNYVDAMNPGYAVFGKVASGKETVDKIRAVATGDAAGHANVPTTPIVIEKAECQ